MVCPWKEKIVSLLYDLSLQKKIVMVAVRQYVQSSAKCYFTLYFKGGAS